MKRKTATKRKTAPCACTKYLQKRDEERLRFVIIVTGVVI